MSDFLRPLSSFDVAAEMPVWMAGALAAVFVVLCLLAFSRARRESVFSGLARFSLVLVGAGIAWILLDASSRRDLASERRALDARATDLTVRAIMPGSALACLSGAAGETVEASCEKALFATPEATAAAVSFVSAQLALLADASDLARRDPKYRGMLAQLRHAAEVDRFGIVAHVLAAREGCSADHCEAFALLNDASRVSTNLAEGAYDAYVARYAAGWPAAADPPVARASTPPAMAAAPAAAPSIGLRVPGPNVFFPSAASIPPVNIMNAEPSAPGSEATGATPPAAKPPTPQRKAVLPARRPAEATPVDINPDAQRAAPPPATAGQ
jgi:hypothetical protein